MDELKQRLRRGLITQAEYNALRGVTPSARAPRSKNGKDTKQGKRLKYVCATCNAAVWGKWGLNIACGSGHLHSQMEAQE